VVDGYEMHGIARVASLALRRDLTIHARTDSPPKDMDAGELLPKSVQVLHPPEKLLHSPFEAVQHPLGHTDTISFIKRLDELAQLDQQTMTDLSTLDPEHTAASSLFLWQEPIIVTRAPGRCDVLGGFAGELSIHSSRLFYSTTVAYHTD
jgi:hypothetical protein